MKTLETCHHCVPVGMYIYVVQPQHMVKQNQIQMYVTN